MTRGPLFWVALISTAVASGFIFTAVWPLWMEVLSQFVLENLP